MKDSGEDRMFTSGTVIDGKWVLMERSGKGGMGEVYRAHQLNLKRDVAIKIVSREFLESLQDDSSEAERVVQRLQREVESMAQVRHPNVLQIFDFGELPSADGDASRPLQYIVMEYVPGNTLRFTMSEEGFGEDETRFRDWASRFFFPVLDAMEAVHETGIVHRDLKPENILMDGDTPKIADFGLARSVRMRAISDSWDVKGTMHYMVPEQFVDFRKVEPTADIYALGKILYEAVEGKMSPSAVPLQSAKLDHPEHPLFQQLDAIIQKATSENPAERYPDIAFLRSALQDALASTALGEERDRKAVSRSQRWVLVLAVAALAAVGAMTVWHLTGGSNKPTVSDTRHTGDKVVPLSPKELQPEIRAKDGKEMALVKTSAGPDETAGGKPLFYIDRQKVTNHDFVAFLNEVRENLTTEEGVVRMGEETWYYLGTGAEPYEQIFLEKGRFNLRDPSAAALPVVRVSFHGAQAYAEHYGKRLPSVEQWRRAARWIEHRLPAPVPETGPATEEDSTAPPLPEHHMNMMGFSANENPQNTAQTLNPKDMPLSDPGIHVKEWAVDETQASAETQAVVVSWETLTTGEKPKPRYRAEGFRDVGFRTLIPVAPTTE